MNNKERFIENLRNGLLNYLLKEGGNNILVRNWKVRKYNMKHENELFQATRDLTTAFALYCWIKSSEDRKIEYNDIFKDLANLSEKDPYKVIKVVDTREGKKMIEYEHVDVAYLIVKVFESANDGIFDLWLFLEKNGEVKNEKI